MLHLLLNFGRWEVHLPFIKVGIILLNLNLNVILVFLFDCSEVRWLVNHYRKLLIHINVFLDYVEEPKKSSTAVRDSSLLLFVFDLLFYRIWDFINNLELLFVVQCFTFVVSMGESEEDRSDWELVSFLMTFDLKVSHFHYLIQLGPIDPWDIDLDVKVVKVVLHILSFLNMLSCLVEPTYFLNTHNIIIVDAALENISC